MKLNQFYIDGAWTAPHGADEHEIINPANGKTLGTLRLGNNEDVDKAVAAAKTAFKSFQHTTVDDRLELLNRVLDVFKSRYDDFVLAITQEMGAPITLSRDAQAYCGIDHLEATIRALENFSVSEAKDGYVLRHEPIGVCGLITPWNWPINQIACKVAPAIAAGCTMVLKPSEYAALSAQLFAEVMHEAGTPAGVFNMVFGDGINVGSPLACHPGVDMVSFTGSTAAGVAVAQGAAPTIKRVSQELGGKSPILLADDVDLKTVVPQCVWLCMENTGQSCNAGTRLIVPAHMHDEVVRVACETAGRYAVGDPMEEDTDIGPLANIRQFEKVKSLLAQAEKEGLSPSQGGVAGINPNTSGYFVPPTIFAGLKNDQLIAREEVFGPVLAIIPYETPEEAIEIANDTPYGLSAYLYAADEKRAAAWASEVRAGMVHVNGGHLVSDAPFGGYKQSGNGREWGAHGLHEFIEVKAIMAKSEEEN
ncbi:MAG: aldehyde dehydrogenase family protein [Kordiimonadaceae bacterium]|nr:aldehyde dehydrogenase family protein [Kordiimonadaceae bacterium]MBO6569302.1 aldehyde dehydrogenase family protein [Kordiimonadaceae bacterium]MBO6964778.1 aldehyde dehydrogenase family protein [Kordiimonadaceae bacterium]